MVQPDGQGVCRDHDEVAWTRVKRNHGAAGVDRQSIAAFEAHAERYLGELRAALRSGRYRPQPVKRVWIEKPGSRERRPLGIPTVKDRIVQTALNWCWSRSSRQALPSRAMGSDRDAAAKTRCGRSWPSWRQGRSGWSTPTSCTTSTASRMTGCCGEWQRRWPTSHHLPPP